MVGANSMYMPATPGEPLVLNATDSITDTTAESVKDRKVRKTSHFRRRAPSNRRQGTPGKPNHV